MQNQKTVLASKLSKLVKRVQFRRVGSQNDGLIHVRKCYLFRNDENSKQLNEAIIDEIGRKSMNQLFNACLSLARTECTILKTFARP